MIDDIALPTPRKRQALELFDGLPRHYDRMGALLSFGQDPRWRRALVVRSTRSPARGCSTWRPAPASWPRRSRAARGARSSALDQSEAMLAAARARLVADPRARRARRRSSEGEAERLPFEDAEFDALTFTYLLRYVDDRAATMRELARVVKPGGRDRDGRVRGPAAAAGCARCGACTRASGCRCSAGSCPRRGSRSAAFWGRASSSCYADEPDLRGLWDAGRDRATCAMRADELRRRRRDVRRARWPAEPPELERPAFYALASGGWRDLVTLLHPPVHGLASELRRARRGRGADACTPTGCVATLGAFALAVGVSAHALDELNGRPLQTEPVATRR